jgi:hypothetical protein
LGRNPVAISKHVYLLAFLLQIVGGDPDMAEEKKRTMAFKDIENLAFSFKSIARIDNLKVGQAGQYPARDSSCKVYCTGNAGMSLCVSRALHLFLDHTSCRACTP